MTIPSSADYKLNVYASSREVKARATFTMSAFSQSSPLVNVYTTDYTGKITGSNTPNYHIAKQGTNITSLGDPVSGAYTELIQSGYDNIKTLNGVTTDNSRNTNLIIAQHVFGFNVIAFLEDKYGKNIWQNRNATLAQKITIAKTLITRFAFNWRGWGSCPAGNKATIIPWFSGAWSAGNAQTHTNGSVTLLSIIRSDTAGINASINSDGYMYFNAYSDASNGTINSIIKTDVASLDLTVTQTTTRTFEDAKIISADVIEEVSMLNFTCPANQLQLQLDNTDDAFNFINLNNVNQIISSRPKIDLEFGVVLSDLVSVEWIPVGTYYVDAWKNNAGNMSVTFTAHDLLYILDNTAFPIQPIGNVGTAVQSLFANAGITDYYYDPSLDSLTGNNRLTRETNSRKLLQNLAITTNLVLYQDRYGTVKIEKFLPLSQRTTYTTYTATQTNQIFGGYASATSIGGQPKAISKQDTDSGMKAITLDQMWIIPEVTLDASIYQINVNVYKNNPTDPTYDIYTYTNPNITGSAGDSFTIDIPLIQSTTVAQAVANRFFTETAYNAIYRLDWRQNPVLLATDVVIINDSATSAKTAYITKQEYRYQGYLTGTSECRGGI